MDRVSEEAATEAAAQKEARAVLSLLLSPLCDTRATEAITQVKQSLTQAHLDHDLQEASATATCTATHRDTSWAAQRRICIQGSKGMIPADRRGGGFGEMTRA